MSRNSLISPLMLIIGGVIITIMILTAPHTGAGGGAPRQNIAAQETEDTSDCGSYPGPDGYIPEQCLNLTTTPAGTQSPSPTGTGTLTTTATTPSATPPTTTTSFATATPEIAPPLPPTVRPTTVIPTPGLTPTPSNALTCMPGEPVLITGNGPPRAAFLLYFGQRAVGGGSIGPSGRFAIPLVVGRERAGAYTVTVRVRGTTQVLQELTCEVPVTAPPLLPSRQPS